MPENRSEAKTHPWLPEALGFWWKLGWIRFGGTAAHLAIMQSELVEKKRWIDSGPFFHGLNHCMLLPGREAQQLAILLPSTVILPGRSLLSLNTELFGELSVPHVEAACRRFGCARTLSNRSSRSQIPYAMV